MAKQNQAAASGNEKVSKASHREASSRADKEHTGKSPGTANAEKEEDSEKAGAAGISKKAGTGAAGIGAKLASTGARVVAAVQKVVAAVAAANTTVQTVVAVGVVVAGTATVGVGGAYLANQAMKWDEARRDCVVYVDKAAIGDSGVSVDTEASVLRNKQRIYSVLFYYGLRPEQCFAILGNWMVESSLDPTAVETVSTEPFRIGFWKQEAIAGDFNPMFHGAGVYQDYFAEHDTINRVGIGLGQWTNDRNKKLLEYATLAGQDGDSKSLKKQDRFEWYDLDVQLAYMLDTSDVGDSGAAFVKDFASIGRVVSDKQVRSEEDSLEFRGDVPANSKYGEVDAIGDGVADSYYDGDMPYSDKTCREDAEKQAGDLCDDYQQAGKYRMYNSRGEYEGEDEEAYKDDFARIYRFVLYENMVKKYTYDFMTGWEGIDNGTYEDRAGYALEMFYEWYGCEEITDAIHCLGDPNTGGASTDFFQVEEGYGHSVLSVLEKTKNSNYALWKIYKTDENMQKCRRIARQEDDFTLARTAATLAWPTRGASEDNDGTRVYQYIHDCVIPGDTIYQSCDRTVCTIVRWSGYDDSFPMGATLNIMAYLVGSPRWAELQWNGNPEELQPGDILIRKDSVATGSDAEVEGDTHHVVMYIGAEAATGYWQMCKTPEELTAGPPVLDDGGHYVVHGSYGERSPGIDVWHDSFSEYHAFRCIHRQKAGNSKYSKYIYDMDADAGSGS